MLKLDNKNVDLEKQEIDIIQKKLMKLLCFLFLKNSSYLKSKYGVR